MLAALAEQRKAVRNGEALMMASGGVPLPGHREQPDSLHSWLFASDSRYWSMFPLFGLFLMPLCHAHGARPSPPSAAKTSGTIGHDKVYAVSDSDVTDV